MALSSTDLPDAFISPLPVLRHPVGHPDQVVPEIVGDRANVFVEQVNRVDQLSVDIELDLVGSIVPNPDRP